MTRFRRAVLRCDAGPALGGGHVKRSLSLAAALARRGVRCRLVGNDAALAIARREAPFVKLVASGPAVFSPELSAALSEAPAETLCILDSPAIENTDEAAVRALGATCLSLVDDAGRAVAADFILAPGLAAHRSDFMRVSPGALVMAGAGFACVDGAFATAIQYREPLEQSRARIVVSFGLTDPTGATLDALKALESINFTGSVDVVLGRQSSALSAVEAFLARGRLQAELHADLPNLAALLRRASLVVGAAGTSSVERCILGVATVAVAVVANQQANASALAAAGAASVVEPGDGLASHLADAIRGLLGNPAALVTMGRMAAGLADPFGADRVAANLDQFRDGAGRRVSLRRADQADAERLLEWQRDSETRRHANNPAVPVWDEHVSWLARKLADRTCCFNIFEVNGEPAGYLRLDRALPSDDWVISIATAPAFRGSGVARQVLALAERLFPGDAQFAEVKDGNAASMALFEAAGFDRVLGGFRRGPRWIGEA